MSNYIVDQNKFKLSGPPEWWLRGLQDFDSSLVVIPSRQGFFYRLAQRRRLILPDHIVQDAMFQQSDTQMLASYGLVPVTTILATAHWNPLMFEELAKRAPHRQGGAEKVIKMIEGAEAEAEFKKHLETDDHLTRNAKDGWRLYRKKIGLGSTMFH